MRGVKIPETQKAIEARRTFIIYRGPIFNNEYWRMMPMRGICIDPGGSTILQEGREYYLFDHGPNFYVSRFDNANAHFGSFRKIYFELIDEQQQEPFEFTGYDDPRRFVAEIIKPYRGYGFNVGDRYIIGPTSSNQGSHFYYYDYPENKFRGCMPVDIFKIIEPFDPVVVNEPEMAQIEPEAVKGTNTSSSSEKHEEKAESKPKQIKYEQLDLFSLMEG